MDTDSSNVVSNNVIGSNSQVSITQNIVHTQTCAINPIPHQLPLAPDLFDRIDIRDSLIYSINSGKRIFLFYGAPGVGKTYCLTKYANEVADRFSDGHIFVDLNDYRALDGSLNVDDLYKFVIRSLTKDCPSNPSDIKSYFRSVTYGKKILLVLDNVTDSFDIDSLVLNSDECLLLSAGNCKEACASYLNIFKSIPVNSFDSSTSVSYFRNQLEECDRIDFDSLENDPLFHKLVSVCDGLPILLSRAAHLIRDNVYTLEEIVSNLSNPEVEPLMGALNLETAHLDDFSSSLYSLLGRIGGGPIALSSLTCISNMKAAVAALQGKSLIELSSTAWLASCSSFESRPLITMNRQISNYAKTYNLKDNVSFEALVQSIVRYYCSLIVTLDNVLTPNRLRVSSSSLLNSDLFSEIKQSNAADYFLSIRFEIFSVLDLAFDFSLYSEVLSMADSCWTFIYDNGLFSRGLHIYSLGHCAAINLGRPDAASRMLALKSRCQLRLSMYEDSLASISLAIELSGDSTNHILKGSLLEFKGHTYREGIADFDFAISCYEAAISEYLQCDPVNNRGIAIANFSIAESIFAQGDYRSALDRVQSELSLSNQLEPNMRSKIELLGAHCLYKLGELKNASSLARSCLDTCLCGGLSGVVADAYQLLGDIEFDLNKKDEAVRSYSISSEIYSQLGDVAQCDIVAGKIQLARF